MKSTSGVYIVGLDHMRAAAAFMVFMWHISHPGMGGSVPFGYIPSFFALSIFNEGHTGVALFMVVSGFVFTLISFGKNIQLGQFYKNRFVRVFPLLFFWCIFAVAVQGSNPTDVARDLFTLIDNKVPVNGWTIIVEAQFYLLFPFMHSAIENRYRSKGLLGVSTYMGGFIIFMWFFRWCTLMEYGTVQMASYATIFGCIDLFLFGSLAFYLYNSMSKRWSNKAFMLLFATSTFILLAFYRWFNIKGGWYGFNGAAQTSHIWVFMPSIEGLLYAGIVVGYVSISRNFKGRISRAVAWIGTVSYSVYLGNTFAIPMLQRLHTKMPLNHEVSFGEYFVWGCLIGFPLLCAFASFTYKYIEQPFLARRRPYLSSSAPPAAE